MTTSLFRWAPRALVAAALGSGVATAQIDTYTDRGDWDAALGGAPDFEEDFSSFDVDTSFRLAPVFANGFSLVQTGFESTFRNEIDVPPFQFGDNNGTTHASSFVDVFGGGFTNVLMTPDGSVSAWGADFNGAGGNELLRIVVTRSNGDQSAFEPGHFDESGADQFWGFVVTAGPPIVSVEFEARFDSGGGGEGFAMDDVAGVFAADVIVIDFETEDDFSTPLVNGQEVTPGDTFGVLVRIEGESYSDLGAAIFDSDPAGPNAGSDDPDLLIDQGNVLILQQEPEQSVPGIYDDPDDDILGGEVFIEFLGGVVTPLSIDVVDLEALPSQDARVTLFDSAGRTRTYTAPSGFTEDRVVDGPPGYRTLDLTTTDDQPGYVASATAEEEAGFDASSVVALEVEFDGSGALDNLAFAPTAEPSGPSPEGYLLIGSKLGSEIWRGADAAWTTQVTDLIAVVPFDPDEAPTIRCAAAGLELPTAGSGSGTWTPTGEVCVQLFVFDPDVADPGPHASQVLTLALTQAGGVRVREAGAPMGLTTWLDVLPPLAGGGAGGKDGGTPDDDPILRFGFEKQP